MIPLVQLANLIVTMQGFAIGGGLKRGLHNILEPAAHAIPVIVGRYFSRFEREVVVLEKKGGDWQV